LFCSHCHLGEGGEVINGILGIIFISTFLFSVKSSAVGKSRCGEALDPHSAVVRAFATSENRINLKSVPVLAYNKAIEPEKFEKFDDHGEILIPKTDSQKLSHLPDGTYVFFLEASGKLLISDRIADVNMNVSDPSARYLITHRTLIHKFIGRYHKEPKIVAPGEFRISQGRVNFLSNKAGTAYSGRQALMFAAQELSQKFGLPIEKNTILKDFSGEAGDQRMLRPDGSSSVGMGDHVLAMWDAFLQISLKDESEYIRLTNIRRKLVALIPSNEIAGTFDRDTFARFLDKNIPDEDNLKQLILHEFMFLYETPTAVVQTLIQGPIYDKLRSIEKARLISEGIESKEAGKLASAFAANGHFQTQFFYQHKNEYLSALKDVNDGFELVLNAIILNHRVF
jgi:hypothetical protein